MFKNAIEKLLSGKMVHIRPRGWSMYPIVKNKEQVILAPIKKNTKLHKGDVVLARVHGNVYLHKISAIEGNRYQISNNRGLVNGWTTRDKVYGIKVG